MVAKSGTANGKKWKLAASLVTLVDQFDKTFKGRSTASDGTIGDTAHSKRKSDHNPNARGFVNGLDITHDPANGIDIGKFCDALIAARPSRLSYIICNGKIISGDAGPSPWKKRPYNKPNKHTKHIHLSVNQAGEKDGASWIVPGFFGAPKKPVAPAKPKPAPTPAKPVEPAPAPAPAPVPVDPDTAPILLSIEDLKAVQSKLVELGYTEVGGIDGIYGKFTRTAISAFRLDNHLPAGDRIDNQFLKRLPDAPPRVIAPARSEASHKTVVEKVPEAKTNWWNKAIGGLGALFTTVSGAVAGALQFTGIAKEQLEPVKEFLTDIPMPVWFMIFGVVLFFIWRNSQKVETTAVEAFRDGSRR